MKLGSANANISICPNNINAADIGLRQKKNNKDFIPEVISNSLESLAAFNMPLVQKKGSIDNFEKFARSDLRTPSEVEALLKKYPNTSRNMGSVPFLWFENVSKQDIPEYTNRIFDIMSDFAQSVSCLRGDHPNNFLSQMDTCASNLENLLGKKTEIHYLSEGTIGRTYKLRVGEEDFVIKTFFKNPVGLGYYSRHGKGAEILSAIYAKSNAPKGYFADFYFGKFARNDDTDGFMVTKFIDYDSAKTSYIRNMMLDRMIEQPISCGNLVGNNSVLDTVVDYGEIRKGRLCNNRQYKIQRLIISALLAEDVEKFKEICKKYDGTDLDYVLDMLSKSFGRISMSRYNDVSSLNEDEIKIMTSDKHNRMFKLLFSVVNDDLRNYENFVAKNKGNPEFEYVIKLFNREMSQEERETFARRVRKTELDKLSEMFCKMGII